MATKLQLETDHCFKIGYRQDTTWNPVACLHHRKIQNLLFTVTIIKPVDHSHVHLRNTHLNVLTSWVMGEEVYEQIKSYK